MSQKLPEFSECGRTKDCKSHFTNALLEDKLVFLRVGAKENVYIPRADEHIFVLRMFVSRFHLSNIRNIGPTVRYYTTGLCI